MANVAGERAVYLVVTASVQGAHQFAALRVVQATLVPIRCCPVLGTVDFSHGFHRSLAQRWRCLRSEDHSLRLMAGPGGQ